MKPKLLQQVHGAKMMLALFFCLIFFTMSSFGQQGNYQVKSFLDYFYAFKGWYGHPDSLKVWIDPNFTPEQKADIEAAMARWNAAGAHPKYVLADSWDDHQVCIFRNDNLPGGGGTCQNIWMDTPNGRFIYHSIISIDTNGDLSVLEIATHELGHAQGLCDSPNPADAMYGGPWGNGTNGALTLEDKLELIRANAYSWIPWQCYAVAPPIALPPGGPGALVFDLNVLYPPDVIAASLVEVSPFYDSLMTVTSTALVDGFLEVGVSIDATHTNCTMGLLVNLMPPEPYEPVLFVGMHYINEDPVPLTDFECPFEIYEENGNVHVDWTEMCTYPFEGELRAELIVDDTLSYLNKGGGNYTIQLEPGNHYFKLHVDDFQVNSAESSEYFLVTGLPHLQINRAPLEIYPNPFSDKCTFNCVSEGDVRIYDINGNLVSQGYGRIHEWDPSGNVAAGVYFIRAHINGQPIECKVVYTGK